MKHRPELTDSGFVTVAGLRAGRSEVFIYDKNNWTSLTLHGDREIAVTVVQDALGSASMFPIGCINLARKLFVDTVRMFSKKKLLVLA